MVESADAGSPAPVVGGSPDPVSKALGEAVKGVSSAAGDAGNGASPGSSAPLPASPKPRGRPRGSKTKKKKSSRARASSSSAGASPDDVRAAAAAALAANERRAGLPPDGGDGGDDLAGGDSGRVSSLTEVELAELIEFFLWGGFRLLPAKVGGGELAEKEQEMLGKVWSRALLPFVEAHSQEAPLIAALIVTGEVVVKRAMLSRVAVDGDGEEGSYK